MDIKKYESYFHDGSVIKIIEKSKKIELTMTSAQIDPAEIQDNMVLSKDYYIKGKLHLDDIKEIKISDSLTLETIVKDYDDISIFHFEIKNKAIDLELRLSNFPPKSSNENFATLEIKADKIYWENIPEMNDEGED